MPFSRSANNPRLRALFALPPIHGSAGKAVAVAKVPAQRVITGDTEVDAVLWLQDMVKTGHEALISKAIELVERIKTPMKTLEQRYSEHLRHAGAHTMQIVFATVDFGELEALAKRSIKKAQRRHEAMSRFGSVEHLMQCTAAELACEEALRSVEIGEFGLYDDTEARSAFEQCPELMPTTIDDCLHVRAFWSNLYWLRMSVEDHCSDLIQEASAHDSYCLSTLAEIPARDVGEATSALDHLFANESMDSKDAESIVRNLVTSGWNSNRKTIGEHRQE